MDVHLGLALALMHRLIQIMCQRRPDRCRSSTAECRQEPPFTALVLPIVPLAPCYWHASLVPGHAWNRRGTLRTYQLLQASLICALWHGWFCNITLKFYLWSSFLCLFRVPAKLYVISHVGCHVNVNVINGWICGIIRDNIHNVYFCHRYWTWVELSGLRIILWQFRNAIDRANLWRLQKKHRSI